MIIVRAGCRTTCIEDVEPGAVVEWEGSLALVLHGTVSGELDAVRAANLGSGGIALIPWTTQVVVRPDVVAVEGYEDD